MINAILGEPLVVGLYTGIGSTTLTDRLSSSNNAVLRESVTQAGAPYSDGVSRWSDLLLSDAVSLSVHSHVPFWSQSFSLLSCCVLTVGPL